MAIAPLAVLESDIVFLVVALFTTGFRLTVRKRVRWGWDDLFAVLATLSMMVQTIVLCVGFLKLGKIQTFTPEDVRAKVAIYYINSITFEMEDWFARLSILFMVYRITSSPYYRRCLLLLAIIFAGCLLYSLIPWIIICARDHTWEDSRIATCQIPSYIPLSVLGVNILADVALVTVPIYLLRTFKPDPLIRQRLQVVFAVTFLLMIAGIVQVVLYIVTPGMIHLLAALVEGFIAVMLSNLSVVLFAILHIFGLRTVSSSATRQRKRMNKPTVSSVVFTNITLSTVEGSSYSTDATPSLEVSFPIRGVTTTIGDRWRNVSDAIDFDESEPAPHSDDVRRQTCTV